MDNAEAFEKFWQAYPKRKGDAAKGPAKKLFEKTVASGVEAEALIRSAKKFAAAESSKVGTEFIMQAQRWLRNRRWEDFKVEATPVLPLGENKPASVFVKMDTPEWDAWVAYRKARGQKTNPVNFGWWFPAPRPPEDQGPER